MRTTIATLMLFLPPLQHSRNASSLPRGLRQLALRPILCIPRVNGQIVLPLRHCLPNTLPRLHRLDPHPPPLPHFFFLPSFPLLWHPQATFLKVVEDP